MKKNLLLYILLAFLIGVNGFFLFNYLGKPGIKGSRGPENFIVKELKFDESQLDKFKTIGNKHHKKMRIISDEIGELKDALFNKISDTSLNNQEIDSIITLIGRKERDKETEVFYHLRAIQELCNDEQKKRFNDIVKNARRPRGNPNQKSPRDARPPRKN